ncbi:MAG: YceI family protein [Legionella sp.]|jgi:polyisoprenoid-binding protein YceI
MLKNLLRVCVLSCITALPVYASENYVIDKDHSFVLWHIDHLGFSTQSGKWYVNGTLELDKQKPQNSKVQVSIDIANMDTGNPELDKHLQAAEFFDTAHFPKATFESNKVVPVGKDKAKVTGILTLHGISKPVTLQVKFNKEGKNPIYDRQTVGFSATGDIKRSDFGMKTLLPALGDTVHLDISAEAYQPKA